MTMKVFKEGIKILVGGKIIEGFLGQKRGLDKFSVAHMVMLPGRNEPLHETRFDEIVIVVQGTLTITQNGKKYKVSTGEVGWVELSKEAAFSNENDVTYEYWAICILAYHPSRVHYPKGDWCMR